MFLSQLRKWSQWRCLRASDSLISDKLHCGSVTARMCDHISPQTKGAHSVLGSSDFPPEQSLLFCPHVTPQTRTPFLSLGVDPEEPRRPGQECCISSGSLSQGYTPTAPGTEHSPSRQSLYLPPGARSSGSVAVGKGSSHRQELPADSRLNSAARNLHCSPSESHSSTHC